MSGLFHDLERYGERIALIGEDGMPLTYRALIERGDAFAANLPARSLVMVSCRNLADCVAGYVGFMRAGCPLILVPAAIKPEQRQDLLTRFSVPYIFAPDESGAYSLIKTGQGAPALHPDLALLMSTSGTTGSRNFVRLSARNLLSNAKSIISYLEITPDDRAITTMPMNYTYGLSILHSHLIAGASVILTDESMVSPAFWQSFRMHQATTFGGVPFIYEMLQKLRFETMDLPSLRCMTQAGGRLGKELVVEFSEIAARKNIRFVVMYGQTEAGPRLSYVPCARAVEKAGSIGLAIPDVALSLQDEEGQEISLPGVAGELVCRGANVSLGYACSVEDLAKGDENQGVLKTGDIATRDAEGYYSIVGRKKRFLKVHGYRVNLDEIEARLKAAGHDCACAGSDDSLRVYVAGADDLVAVKAEMNRFVTLHPQGVKILAVAVLPRSESGKVDYAALQEGCAS